MAKWDSCIFDLDGTLWDSVANIAVIWNDVIAAEDDIPYTIGEEQVVAIMGLTTAEIADRLFPDLAPKRRMEVMLRCVEAESRRLPAIGGTLYPGVEETLAALAQKLPLFIVSNCDKGYIEAFLSHHRLSPRFTDFICYGDTGRDKPENIRHIIEKHRLKNAVYIGDTEKDRRSAALAGIDFIFAAYGFGDVPAAPYTVSSFSDLNGLIIPKE
ncbi:MAG: HAD family hydrolase [Bacillota bacterium]|jgi:phosphoglycolate phosphatase